MTTIKEETWKLTSGDTAVIPAKDRADGVAKVWSDIWKYQVPTGQAHILKPEHHFAAHLRNVAANNPEVGFGDSQLKLVIRDQSEQDEKAIYGPALYITSKEFQDVRKMARLTLLNDLPVEEKFFIVIQSRDGVGVREELSYFELETIRIRSTI